MEERKDENCICIWCCVSVYPWIKGGAEKRIYEISKRLVERGHEDYRYWKKMGRRDYN